MSPYCDLASAAERELVLLRTGRWDELRDAIAERAYLTASLPPVAPPEARDALERVAGIQTKIVDELAAARDAAGRELGRLRSGRGAVRAYGQLARPSSGGSYA